MVEHTKVPGRYIKLAAIVVSFFATAMGIMTALHYPYDTDATPARPRDPAKFYTSAYSPETAKKGADYEEVARKAAELFGITDVVKKFVADYGLANKKVLDVGSGRGYLQDLVDDYTGLDLSASAARNYHKRFVVGSATNMPFADNSFDAAWTVWVMEHIPEPERAFREMRRVVKPGGLLMLYVAWSCVPWAAEGFEVRPYSDFNLRGKLVKASIPVRRSPYFIVFHRQPTRLLRWAHFQARGANEHLHFRRLDPNYDIYWQADSDAAVSLDGFEAYLWFRAAGDRCLNCSSTRVEFMRTQNPLIIKIQK